MCYARCERSRHENLYRERTSQSHAMLSRTFPARGLPLWSDRREAASEVEERIEQGHGQPLELFGPGARRLHSPTFITAQFGIYSRGRTLFHFCSGRRILGNKRGARKLDTLQARE